MVSAPSLFDAYGGSAFPGLGDLLYKLEQIPVREVSEEYARVVKQIRKHVSDIMIIIKRAAHYLKPVKVIHDTLKCDQAAALNRHPVVEREVCAHLLG